MAEVGVIGGGAAGMGAAYALTKAGHEVTVLEAGARLGGHCLGAEVKRPGGSSVFVDVGVSDFNRATFTNVGSLFDELGVAYRPINQDSSFMLPDRRTVWFFRDGEPRFRTPPHDEARLRAEIARFKLECVEVLDDPTFRDWSLERYCDDRGYSDELRELYLYPRAQGSFPMPDRPPARYRVKALVAFWRIHGIAGPGPSDRNVIVGGMHSYTAAFERWLTGRGGRVLTRAEVVGVARRREGARVRVLHGGARPETLRFEELVIAVPANAVVPLLEDASEEEKQAFDGFGWQRARAVVHHDARLLPDEREAWGAYNYLVSAGDEPAIRPVITFYANRLAGLADDVPDTFVSVNPHREPDPAKVVSDHFFVHPAVVGGTERSRARVDQLQGKRGTWYCGSYLTEPWVHEQAFSSGLEAAERLLRRRSTSAPRGSVGADDFLRQVPLFEGLDTAVLSDVQLLAEPFTLATGDVLFRQNDEADGMYLVEAGLLRVSSRTPGDDDVELVSVGRGALLGEMSLLDGERRSATATAAAPTRGFFVGVRRFQGLRADLRPSAFDLMDRIGREVARRTRAVIRQIGAAPLANPPRGPALREASPALAPRAAGEADDHAVDDVARRLTALWPSAELNAREVEHLLAMGDVFELPRGHVLTVEGERPRGLALVLRGAVRASVSRAGALEQLGVHGPGALVGSVALMDGEAQPLALDVREHALLLFLDRRSFESLRKGYSELSFKLFRELHAQLARDLRRLNRHVGRVQSIARFNELHSPERHLARV